MVDTIKRIFKAIGDWFTPSRRKAVYQLSIAVLGVLFAAGVITPEMVEEFKAGVVSIGAVLAMLVNILALANVNPIDPPSESE